MLIFARNLSDWNLLIFATPLATSIRIVEMEAKTFVLKSGSDNFKSKQRSLFEILATVEKDVNLAKEESQPMEVDAPEQSHRERKKNRSRTRALRGQESLFKVPGLPPLRPRMPDHRRNPSRWTKYSLADVAPADMSEASNTAAAMDFLRSMRDETPDVREELPTRVKFNRSKRTQRARAPESADDEIASPSELAPPRIGFGDTCTPIRESPPLDKPIFRQSRLVMPEYVVGEKIAKPKKERKPQDLGKELALSHWLEFEDD